jgi:hypothetical protein
MNPENNSVEYVGENFAILHGGGAVVSLAADAATKPATSISTPYVQGTPMQNWGANNLKPTEQRQKLEKTTTAYPLLIKMATTLFGRGPQYYREIRTAKGIERDYSAIPEIEDFILNNDLELIMLERWMDLKMYNNIFCEFIFNTKNDKIVNIWHQEAEFCRFGLIENNIIKNVRINSNWSERAADFTEVNFLDDYSIRREEVLKFRKKFITHNNLPSPGRTLYAVPQHIGLFETNGWLDYSLSVPILMNKINNNGFNLRYHIEIPYDYWEKIYKDWNTKTPTEKKTLQDAKMDEMNTYLQGNDNAGRNFYSHFGIHQATGKEISGWKITELKDPIKKDQFLTSLQEADMQTARAIGVDVSLANISTQSNSMGAGSGSDKRVGMDNTISASYAEQMIVLKPLRTVGIVNQWPSNVKWTFEHIVPTTLNEDKSGTKIVN